MPKGNQQDMCLICDETPCACRAKPKKTLPARQALPKNERPTPPKLPAVEQPARPPARAGLSAVRWPEPKPAPAKRVLPPAPVARRDPEEDAMANAVTLFVKAGMVAESSIREHRRLVKLTDHEIRAILWRQRREAS